ncbi:MAG: diguanylate cyclase [Raoultibacter sp.]|jgi:diguanylate cyclase (GGDEF)-like protein
MSDTELSNDQLIDLFSRLLNDPKFSTSEDIELACKENPKLESAIEALLELRKVSCALSRGKIDEKVIGRGYILSCIKALQANLNHMAWQLEQVSKGDFSQRIDYLGNFSDSFNAMCQRLEGQSQALNELARQDGLTKLANRQYLNEYMADLFEGNRFAGTDLSIMLFDLDYFKRINDTYGHEAGDIVLQNIAQELKTAFRTSDFIARYGGEEFVVILPGINLEQAKVIAGRALDYIRNTPIRVNGDLEISITTSVGISEKVEADTKPEDVLRRSDMALYKAKLSGRDRYEWVTAEDARTNPHDYKASTPIESDLFRQGDTLESSISADAKPAE